MVFMGIMKGVYGDTEMLEKLGDFLYFSIMCNFGIFSKFAVSSSRCVH